MSWRLQFFQPPKSSGPAYVKDGLVLWLDGIDNAGVGVHDPNAKTWTDLVGTSEFSLYNTSVEGDAMHFGVDRKRGYAWCAGYSLPSETFTVELCLEDDMPGTRCVYAGLAGRFAVGRLPNGVVTPNDTTYPRSKYQMSTLISGTVSFPMSKSGVGPAYENAIAKASIGQDAWASQVGGMIVGTRWADGVADFSEARFHSVRIYSRALTAEEIAQNYAVDKERFSL